MTEKEVFERLWGAILALDEEKAEVLANEIIQKDLDLVGAIEEGPAKALRDFGERFEKGELFLPELIVGAETAEGAIRILESAIPKGRKMKPIGKVIIGTVQGDIHDIGKNIVATLLEVNGFEVHNLGKDVSAERFVEEVKKVGPDIVGLSALMTTTMPHQRQIIQALKRANLRQNVKVMIGGAAVSEEWSKEIGADGFSDNAISAVRLAKKLLKNEG